MTMNRPHIAALLRIAAGEAKAAAYLLMADMPASEAEAKLIAAKAAERLRVRAGEIEAGG